MGWLIIALLLASCLVYWGVVRLRSGYSYGIRSRLVLTSEAGIVPLVVGMLLKGVFPDLSGLLFGVLLATISAPTFVAVALITVEIWRKIKQWDYDRVIAELEQREYECFQGICSLDEKLRKASKARQNVSHHSGGKSDPEAEFLDKWQKEGGAARVRAIKVQEWTQMYEARDELALERRRRELEQQIAEAPCLEIEDQLRAEWCVIMNILRKRSKASRKGETNELTEIVASLEKERNAKFRELEIVRADLNRWREKRREFLSRRIELG